VADDDALPRDRFFAMYVQAVHQISGTRHQWMVLPPIDVPDRPGFSNTVVYWERIQSLDKQKPVWRMQASADGSAMSIYSNRNLWRYAEPIVVRVRPFDVRKWITEAKTPYDLISLLQRAATRKGLVIAGPTSKPQVVTSPPSS